MLSESTARYLNIPTDKERSWIFSLHSLLVHSFRAYRFHRPFCYRNGHLQNIVMGSMENTEPKKPWVETPLIESAALSKAAGWLVSDQIASNAVVC